MYINKFKCDNPETFAFKEGVAFCKSCNKNVYNSEEVDLTQIMQSGETICASVPASKIAWIERSVLTMGIVAASLVTPIDSFAQKQIAIDTILVSRTSNYYVGKFVDEQGNSVSQVTISIFDKGRLLRQITNNEDGSFKIEIPKNEILYAELSMRIYPRSNQFYKVQLIDLPDGDLDLKAIKLDKIEKRMGGDVAKLPLCTYEEKEERQERDIDKLDRKGKYIKFKDPKPSGATFRREDLRNGIR